MRFAAGESRHLQYAPYLDLRPLESSEPDVATILARPEAAWITRELEAKAQPHAIATIVPAHIADVRGRTIERIDKTEAAVKDRLTKEINYWDHRAEELRLQERAGRAPARLNSEEARKRADALQGRLEKRIEELRLERQLSPLPPLVLGGLLVVPAGLLAAMAGKTERAEAPDTGATRRSHRWCDNCRGAITSSFSARPNAPKNASSTRAWRFASAGANTTLSGSFALPHSSEPSLGRPRLHQQSRVCTRPSPRSSRTPTSSSSSSFHADTLGKTCIRRSSS